MAQRITVKSVITKPTKKEGTNITTIEDEKGAKMSAFNDTALAQVHAGDVLEVNFTLDGKYTNITGWELIESKPQPAPTPVPQPAPREPFISDPSRNASIEAQTAYGKIMDNWEKDIPKSMKDAAVHWGLLKLNFKQAPEKPVVKESVVEDALESGVLLTKGSQTARPTGMPASLTDGAKLFAYVNKKGISLIQFNAIVQSSPNEVKSEEQLIAAWNVLAPKMVK